MKLSNIVFLVVGIEILLWISGLNDSIGIALTDIVGQNPLGIASSWIFTQADYILGLGAVAVVAGFFVKGSTENALVAGVAAFFLKFLSDLVGLIMITNSYCEAFTEPYSSCAWVTWLVVCLVVPLIVVFVMSILDWWRSRD